jgi:phosphatidylglycerophosphate synthase
MIREIAVAGLREFLGPLNIVIKASFIAKTKTTVQLIALGLTILVPLVPNLASAAKGTLWAAAALTLYSGYEYFLGAWPHLKEEKK